MELSFSFIIPVYNRPDEIRELLESMLRLQFFEDFEIVIVEDGSSLSCKNVVEDFENSLNISYFSKNNSGPGDSRNFGMKRAKGNYFLILDSDVILPPDYLEKVKGSLERSICHCFGGPDAAHPDFSDLQKAISYSMTSFFTTGGIRGGKKGVGKFQPRSFNMGLSKEAFEASGGFGRIHPGEDPDLALRLQKMDFETVLFPEVRVFHKRRLSWEKFYRQVYKFGLVRPILNRWHKGSGKITFWFPSVFILGFLVSIFLFFLEIKIFLLIYCIYFLLIILDASFRNRSISIGFMALWASLVQFSGYGFGFCRSTFYLGFLKKDPEKVFPQLFFSDDKKN